MLDHDVAMHLLELCASIADATGEDCTDAVDRFHTGCTTDAVAMGDDLPDEEYNL